MKTLTNQLLFALSASASVVMLGSAVALLAYADVGSAGLAAMTGLVCSIVTATLWLGE